MKRRFFEIAQNVILPTIAGGILLLSLVVFAEIGLNAVSGLLFNAVDINAERTVLALGALDDINLATIKEKNTLLEKGPAQVEKNMREYSELMRSALEKLDRLKVITDTEDRSTLVALAELATQYRNLMEGMEFPLIKLGRMDQAFALSFKEGEGGGRTLRQTIRAGLEKIVEANKKEMFKNRRKAEATSAYTKDSLVFTAVVGLAIMLIWVSVVQIARPSKSRKNREGSPAHEELDVDVEGMDQKDKVAVITRALEVFKDNATEAKRLAEAEEEDCARLLKSIKKD